MRARINCWAAVVIGSILIYGRATSITHAARETWVRFASHLHKSALYLTLLIFWLCSTLPRVVAATVTYTGPDGGNWNVAANWTSGINHFVPANGDDAVLGTVTGINSVNFNTSYINPGLNSLTLDATVVPTFTLNQTTDGTAMYAQNEYIGATIYGNFYNQSAGTNTVDNNLNLGAGVSASQGAYTLSGTGVLNARLENIGQSNSLSLGGNVFTQTGGTNTADDIRIGGNLTNGVGAYNMTGGTLSAINLYVGTSTGVGNTFTQSGPGGSVTVTLTHLGFPGFLGVGQGGTGTYNLASGSLTVTPTSFLMVGDGGTGFFNHTGGALVNGALIVGYSGAGTYTLSNTGTISGTDYETVGFAFGTGIFTQTGGSNILPAGRTLTLGDQNTGNGTYNLSASTGAGTLQADFEIIGNSGTGAFNQDGGANTVANTLTICNGGSSGAYTLNSGSLSAVTVQLYSRGTFTQNGGTLNATTFNQSGGAVNGTLQNQGTFNYNSGTFNGRLRNQGSINFNANFTAGNGIESDTSFSVGAARIVTVNGAGLDNEGTITLAGGTLNGSGAMVSNVRMTGFGIISGSGGFTNNGLVTQSAGDITFSNTGLDVNYGTINLAAGQLLQFQSNPLLINYGALTLNNAFILGAGSITNGSTGTVTGPGMISSSFTSSGVVQVAAGALDISSSWFNTGVVQLSGAGATLTGGSITNSGTIQGTGSVSSAISNTTGTIEAVGGVLTLRSTLTNAAGGTIAAGAGNKVLLATGLPLTNAGFISLTGGTFDNGGATLDNTGSIIGYGTLRTGGLTNDGAMTLTGGTSTVNGNVINANGKTINIKYQPAIFTGNITNNGTIKTTSTTVTFTGTYTGNAYISDPSTNIFQNHVTITTGGQMTGSTGDIFNFSGGNFTNNGTFNNGGTLISSDPSNNSGSFTQSGPQAWSATTFTNSSGVARFQSDAGSPSASPLTMNVSGGVVTFTVPEHLAALSIANPNGALELELASTVNFGKGVVAGQLVCGGTLQVSLVNGFSPALGNSFDILDWGTRSGTFSNLQLPVLSAPLIWNTSQLYSTGVLSVIDSNFLPGDINRDGHVDVADVAALMAALADLNKYQSTNSLTNQQLVEIGDLTGDGRVTNTDIQGLMVLLANGGGGGSLTAVPEPAALSLAVLGALGVLSLRRRRF